MSILRFSDSSSASLSSGSTRRNSPSPIGSISYLQYENLRFLIHDSPTHNNIKDYLKEFKKYSVSVLVRCCESTYSDADLLAEGIEPICLKFEDGGTPSDQLIKNWLSIVKKVSAQASDEDTGKTIAIHCVAGLGRAPVLVAVALIENGMEQLDAIELVRSRRRGAFNNRQIQYLAQYKRIASAKPKINGIWRKLFNLDGKKKSTVKDSQKLLV
jgi:protein tyrosine phosphatase type 4A